MRSLGLKGIFSLWIASAGHAAEQSSLATMPSLADSAPIQIVEGPILLHANATGEWGGHTFPYIVTGEKYVFWAGMRYEPGRTSRTMLVGQYPLKGVDKPPAITSISLEAADFYNSALPL